MDLNPMFHSILRQRLAGDFAEAGDLNYSRASQLADFAGELGRTLWLFGRSREMIERDFST